MAEYPFNNLLVPVDFSEASREAFVLSESLVGGEEPGLIVLHVVDEALLELMVVNEMGHREELASRLRSQAERRLAGFTQPDNPSLQIDRVVSIGNPFLEILRKSNDFDVDAIVMGKVGTGNRFEKLLFGTTAERVLRGSSRPVLVYPSAGQSVSTESEDWLQSGS